MRGRTLIGVLSAFIMSCCSQELAPTESSLSQMEGDQLGSRGGLIPEITVQNADVVAPMTFIDGVAIEVTYRGNLGLVEKGVRPRGTVRIVEGEWEGCGRSLEGQLGSDSFFREPGAAPLASFEGELGQVSLWPAPSQAAATQNLVFQLQDWFLGAPIGDGDGCSNDEVSRIWATGIGGIIAPTGFPVLQLFHPVRFDPAQPIPGLAILVFGDPPVLEVKHQNCADVVDGETPTTAIGTAEVVMGEGFGSWCLQSDLTAIAYGPDEAVAQLVEGVTARVISR